MNIYDYTTSGGKTLIMEYIESLPAASKAEILAVRQLIQKKGIDAFSLFITRQLYKKLWKIKFFQERTMYVIQDQASIYFLNIYKKEKAEKQGKRNIPEYLLRPMIYKAEMERIQKNDNVTRSESLIVFDRLRKAVATVPEPGMSLEEIDEEILPQGQA